MKKLIIFISFAAMLMSCSKNEVWLDNDNPGIYLPQEGVSINTAWKLDNNEFVVNFGVYLSGIRPENQNNNIEVTFEQRPSMIAAYNSNNTNFYVNQLDTLPPDCYQIASNKVTIASGNISATVPIKVFTDKLDALPKTNAFGKILYTIPIRLINTTHNKLSADTTMLSALCVMQVDYPRFYFWTNRSLTTAMGAVGRKVIYGGTPTEEKFRVTSFGLSSDEAYTLNFDINPNPAVIPAGGFLLQSTAYELPSATLTIPKGTLDGYFGVKIINDSVAFRKVFYLPVRIASVSKYQADSIKGTLLLKIEAKNDYEWSYTSKISSYLTATQRSLLYSATKTPASYDANTMRIQMSTNGTNANDANYGPQVLTATDWTSAGWTGGFVAGWTHTTGNTSVLSHIAPAEVGWSYRVSYTVTGRTAGTFQISLGGTSTVATLSATGSTTLVANSTAGLTVTPTSTFNGKIVLSVTKINAFNDRYYRLKIIPNASDKRNWGVEIIRITDEGMNNTPADLEFNPDPAKRSYYDYDYETFYLNYRWKNLQGFWIEVNEILEATFF